MDTTTLDTPDGLISAASIPLSVGHSSANDADLVAAFEVAMRNPDCWNKVKGPYARSSKTPSVRASEANRGTRWKGAISQALGLEVERVDWDNLPFTFRAWVDPEDGLKYVITRFIGDSSTV